MVELENRYNPRVEVVGIEVSGQTVFLIDYHIQTGLDQVQTLHDAGTLEQAGFGEQIEHEYVEKFLVEHQLD